MIFKHLKEFTLFLKEFDSFNIGLVAQVTDRDIFAFILERYNVKRDTTYPIKSIPTLIIPANFNVFYNEDFLDITGGLDHYGLGLLQGLVFNYGLNVKDFNENINAYLCGKARKILNDYI